MATYSKVTHPCFPATRAPQPSKPREYLGRPLNTTHYIRLLFRRSSRLTLPRKRPPPLEHIYCLLRRATLFFFFAVDACSGGGKSN